MSEVNETKKCKYCQSDINKKAKVCSFCKNKQGSKIGLFVFLGIIIIIIISSKLGVTQYLKDDNKVGEVTKANYDKISYGMTKEQVFKIMGSEATITKQVQGGEVSEHYVYESFFNSINVVFSNGKVSTTYWQEDEVVT